MTSVPSSTPSPADQTVIDSIKTLKVGKTTEAFKVFRKETNSANLKQAVDKISNAMKTVGFAKTNSDQKKAIKESLQILEKDFESVAESERGLGSKILDYLSPDREGAVKHRNDVQAEKSKIHELINILNGEDLKSDLEVIQTNVDSPKAREKSPVKELYNLTHDINFQQASSRLIKAVNEANSKKKQEVFERNINNIINQYKLQELSTSEQTLLLGILIAGRHAATPLQLAQFKDFFSTNMSKLDPTSKQWDTWFGMKQVFSNVKSYDLSKITGKTKLTELQKATARLRELAVKENNKQFQYITALADDPEFKKEAGKFIGAFADDTSNTITENRMKHEDTLKNLKKEFNFKIKKEKGIKSENRDFGDFMTALYLAGREGATNSDYERFENKFAELMKPGSWQTSKDNALDQGWARNINGAMKLTNRVVTGEELKNDLYRLDQHLINRNDKSLIKLIDNKNFQQLSANLIKEVNKQTSPDKKIEVFERGVKNINNKFTDTVKKFKGDPEISLKLAILVGGKEKANSNQLGEFKEFFNNDQNLTSQFSKLNWNKMKGAFLGIEALKNEERSQPSKVKLPIKQASYEVFKDSSNSESIYICTLVEDSDFQKEAAVFMSDLANDASESLSAHKEKFETRLFEMMNKYQTKVFLVSGFGTPDRKTFMNAVHLCGADQGIYDSYDASVKKFEKSLPKKDVTGVSNWHSLLESSSLTSKDSAAQQKFIPVGKSLRKDLQNFTNKIDSYSKGRNLKQYEFHRSLKDNPKFQQLMESLDPITYFYKTPFLDNNERMSFLKDKIKEIDEEMHEESGLSFPDGYDPDLELAILMGGKVNNVSFGYFKEFFTNDQNMEGLSTENRALFLETKALLDGIETAKIRNTTYEPTSSLHKAAYTNLKAISTKEDDNEFRFMCALAEDPGFQKEASGLISDIANDNSTDIKQNYDKFIQRFEEIKVKYAIKLKFQKGLSIPPQGSRRVLINAIYLASGSLDQQTLNRFEEKTSALIKTIPINKVNYVDGEEAWSEHTFWSDMLDGSSRFTANVARSGQ